MKVKCEAGIAKELHDFFTFTIQNHRFHPLVKQGFWDGKMSMFNLIRQTLYVGLEQEVARFAKERDYEFIGLPKASVDMSEAEAFVKDGSLFSSEFEQRDYQIETFLHCLRNERALVVSPTASGKSFIIYLLCMWYLKKRNLKRILLVVPTKALVEQMDKDFASYAVNPNQHSTHLIYEGREKDGDADITITTWQSVFRQPKAWFKKFDIIFGDEAHEFKAKSLIKIMESLTETRYRFGTTGTLDGIQMNKMTLEGLFGPKCQFVTTSELIDMGFLSQLSIKAVVLHYSDEFCKVMNRKPYDEEISTLISMGRRNNFLMKMVLSLQGNTLVLFHHQEHGKFLFQEIQKLTNRKVYLIYGKIDVVDREDARQEVEELDDAIILASYGTFSRGVNIKRLHNIVTAHPIGKSRTRVLQSIGRVLRRGAGKEMAVLYDIADRLVYKKWENHTLKHFRKRVEYYTQEKFDFTIHNHRINQ